MPVDRPTFHESWYRVADLRPRLLSGVKVYRQHFRGQMWHVIENPSSSQYSRLSEEAYRLVGLLDSRRTVSEVWNICNEQLGDRAPTQPEVIQILGQLFAMNLLYVDLPPDTESLFNRYHKRVKREVLSYFTNILFVRIPLYDPDLLLERWVGIVGSLYSWAGLFLWFLLLAAGLYFVIGNFNELVYQASDVLSPSNLILLYLTLVVVKVCHEFSHAFACKRFGLLNRNSGQVHTMGVMFLVFFPLPYVDVSSVWAFRNKWHRAVVGLAGVIAEIAVASVAAIIWARTSTGTLHIIAYNTIFVASVSTLLFNGNPLLRYDAYYVLSDLLEIPNLGQRSQGYLYYLVKRYLWGLKKISSPAYSLGERIWFVLYGISSAAYRIFISIRILLFLNRRLPDELFIVVPMFAFAAIIGWVLIPLGRFLKYLTIGPELARKRLRAVTSTVGFLCAAIVLLGLVRVPDYWRVEGVVEPSRFAIVHAQTDGFVTDFLPSESRVFPSGSPLIKAFNPQLDSERKSLIAERRGLEAQKRINELKEVAAGQILQEQIQALSEKIVRVESQLTCLNLSTPCAGTWVAPEIERTKDVYLQRGQRIGFVGSLDDVIVRATAGQNVAAMVIEQADRHVEMRAKGRPQARLLGDIDKIFPAGQDTLPSGALGYTAGGATPTRSRDPNDVRAAENFFELRIIPVPDQSVPLLTGQRVIVRIRMAPKPLAMQWWQSARQLFQRRFHI